jgi:hypothetical protein
VSTLCLRVYEPWCSVFQPCVITVSVPCIHCVTFCSESLRLHGWLAGCHSTHLLLLLRSLSALPSWVFIKWGWLLSCFVDWDSINHLICFVLPKSVGVLLKITSVAFLLFQVILCCYLCVICSWNQISILYWQRIAVFVTVLSLPVTDGHWNCTVCLLFAELRSEFDVQPEQSCKLHIVFAIWAKCTLVSGLWGVVTCHNVGSLFYLTIVIATSYRIIEAHSVVHTWVE